MREDLLHRLLHAPAGLQLRRCLIVALAYAAFGKLGLMLAIPPGYATAVWPPSGLALAATLVWGWRVFPGVLLGSFIVNVATSWDVGDAAAMLRSLALALAIGCGAAAQAVVGAWLILRGGRFENIFTQEVAIIRALMLGGPASCVVNSVVGVGSLWVAGLIPAPNLLFNAWTWWVGDTIGVLIFTPLICAWTLASPRQWLRQQLALTVPMGVIFAAVVALFFYISANEQQRLFDDFEERARSHADALQKTVDAQVQVLSVMRSFFAASEHVTRAEFETFVNETLRTYPAVQTVGWSPRLEAAQLADFEQAMRRELGEHYRVHELDAEGAAIPAQARALHFPIAYLAPSPGNEKALGYDIGSEPVRREAIERALQTDRPSATARVQLVQDRGQTASVILYLALNGAHRSKTPLGLASAVMHVDGLARSALAGLVDAGLHAHIFDGPVGDERRALLDFGPDPQGTIAHTLELPVHVADRQWTLQVMLPADYLVAHRSWQAWGLLAVGLSLAALLGMLLLVLLARQAKVEELVGNRTAELREAEQRFRGLLEAAPDAILMIDQTGCIELVNRQAEQLFGYTRTELLGLPVDRLVPERFRGAHAGHRQGYFRDPHARQMGAGLDLSAQRRDGSEFPVEISFGPVRIGARNYVVAAARDVSDRAAVQRKLANYAADLERSNKELEQFAYVASHDLQAPVRGTLSFAQLLRQRYLGRVLEGKGEEFLRHIEDSAHQMEALIKALLALSRVGRREDQDQDVSCEQVLAQVESQLAGMLRERGAQISHEPLPMVRATPTEVLQVLQNLIVNGLKFQPGVRPRVHISALREGPMWRLSVRDEGIGIAPKDQDRIFRIFQRLHAGDAYEGTGIGLAICQKIVLSRGGRIWVESIPGQGATFHFTLPAADARTAA